MPIADLFSRWSELLGIIGRRRPSLGPEAARRVAMTLRCRDTDPIPKVPEAGKVIRRDGLQLQVMHDGTLVTAGGYHGDWMKEIIRGLRGHHEPQEEIAFYHVLGRCRPGTVIVEVGAFWAYYTNWYLGAVAGSSAVCVEPDANNMACGERNLAINGRSARWVNACVGREHLAATTIRRESDGATVSVPCHSLDSLLDLVGRRPIEMLHVDCQGAELPLLESLGRAAEDGLLRFVVVSTHHASISGSPTTHQDCLRQLQALGATILCEHTVEESFSGDGLVVASFLPADAAIDLPTISRNTAAESLFAAAGRGPGDRSVVLADTHVGPMLVYERDTVIGRNLRTRGAFEEGLVVEVVRFLRQRHGFRPRLFVDVGANIGTHLLRALYDGLFQEAVGVEMESENFRLLACNVRLNHHERWTRLFCVALSDRPGAGLMELSEDNRGDHRVRIGDATIATVRQSYGESDRHVQPIDVTTLDALESECGMSFDDGTLVWVDVQGHEGHVVEGAATILARDRRPVVVIEFWPYGVERCGGRDMLFRFLRRCRAIHDLRSPGWQTKAAVTAAELESMYDRTLADADGQSVFHTDLLCIV